MNQYKMQARAASLEKGNGSNRIVIDLMLKLVSNVIKRPQSQCMYKIGGNTAGKFLKLDTMIMSIDRKTKQEQEK